MFGFFALRDLGGSQQGAWSQDQNIPTGLKKANEDQPYSRL